MFSLKRERRRSSEALVSKASCAKAAGRRSGLRAALAAAVASLMVVFFSSESALEQFGCRGKNLSGSSRDVSDWRDFLFGTAYLLTLDGPQVDPCRQRVDTQRKKEELPKSPWGSAAAALAGKSTFTP